MRIRVREIQVSREAVRDRDGVVTSEILSAPDWVPFQVEVLDDTSSWEWTRLKIWERSSELA